MNDIRSQSIWTSGIRYMLLAVVAYSIMFTIIKELKGIHVFQIVFFRSLLPALISFGMIRRRRIAILGNRPRLLLLRAFFGLISMTLFFVTLQRMPFGLSVVLKYFAPLFAVIFSSIVLAEKVKNIQWFLIILALIGVFIIKGVDSRVDSLNLILGMIGAIFGGLVYTTIRKIGSSENSLVIVFYFMTAAVLCSGVMMISRWETPSPYYWSLLLLLGLTGYFGQLWMTRAFQSEKTSIVAPIRYLEVILAFGIGWILYDESLNALSIGAVVLIISSMTFNIIVASRK